MTRFLTNLRDTPQPSPGRFLAAHPGCWVQYDDDTGANDAGKALSVRSFDPAVAERKQRERCGVCYSLQAFGTSHTKDGFLCFRNLGVDVNLVLPPERATLTTADVDRRKGEYLEECLLAFPLKPHWVVEIANGFHIVFRVQPIREAEGVRDALAVNLRLVRALRGDEDAVRLTQILRVPGTFQFNNPQHPFFCLLLLDNACRIAPYHLDAVGKVIDTRESFHGPGEGSLSEGQPNVQRAERPITALDGGELKEGVWQAVSASRCEPC
jgi:hypothetical protein